MAIRRLGDQEEVVLDQKQAPAVSTNQPASTLRKLAPGEEITLDSERSELTPRATSPIYYPKAEEDPSLLGHLKAGAVDAGRRFYGMQANVLDTLAQKADRAEYAAQKAYYDIFGYPEPDPNAVDTLSVPEGNVVSEGLRQTADEIFRKERNLAGINQAANVVDTVEWDEINPFEQEISDIEPGKVGRFVLEQGARSLPEMAIAFVPVTGLPSITATTAQNILEERQINQGRSATDLPASEDMSTALATGVVSAGLERLGVLGDVASDFGGTAARVSSASQLPTAMLKSGAGEAATEFVQEGTEYVGSTLGTDKEVTGREFVESGMQGSLVGGPTGAAVRGGTEAVGLLGSKSGAEIIDDGQSQQNMGSEQAGPDGAAETVQTEPAAAPEQAQEAMVQENQRIAAQVDAPVGRDDLAEAIANNTPLPEKRTIDLPDVPIAPELQAQGFQVGGQAQQVNEDGEVIEGTVASAEMIDGELEVTVVDPAGNLRTLFAGDGQIAAVPLTPPAAAVALPNQQAVVTDQTLQSKANSIDDLRDGLGSIGSAIGDSFVQGFYDTLSGGPNKSSAFRNERQFKAAQEAFKRGEIRDAQDLRRFLETGSSGFVPAKPAPAKAKPENPYTAMGIDDLKSSMEYIKNQVKGGGGWNKMLTDNNRKIRAELDSRFPGWDTPEKVEAAAQEALPEPTEAQKEAGNYKKGHVSIQGLPVSIEIAKGGKRRGKSGDGTEWETDMPAHYGYIKRTKGADGEQVDVYVGDNPEAENVYVVDQIYSGGAFDEHKAMIGFPSQEAATAAYQAAFSDGSGAGRMGAVTAMPMAEFKNWLKTGNNRKPVAYKMPDFEPAGDALARRVVGSVFDTLNNDQQSDVVRMVIHARDTQKAGSIDMLAMRIVQSLNLASQLKDMGDGARIGNMVTRALNISRKFSNLLSKDRAAKPTESLKKAMDKLFEEVEAADAYIKKNTEKPAQDESPAEPKTVAEEPEPRATAPDTAQQDSRSVDQGQENTQPAQTQQEVVTKPEPEPSPAAEGQDAPLADQSKKESVRQKIELYPYEEGKMSPSVKVMNESISFVNSLTDEQYKFVEEILGMNPRNFIGTHNAEQTLRNLKEIVDEHTKRTKTFVHNGVTIYPTTINGKNYWAVQQPGNAEKGSVMGDTLHEIREDAIEQAERDISRRKNDAERERELQAEKEKEQARKDKNRGKSITERRADAVLDKAHNFNNKSVAGMGNTRREVIQSAIEKGWRFEEEAVTDTAAKKRDQDKIDRAQKSGYILGLSNENIPAVKEALEARARLKDNKYSKPEYVMYVGDTDTSFTISKTEYDYAQSLTSHQADTTPKDQGQDDAVPEGLKKTFEMLDEAISEKSAAGLRTLLGNLENKRTRARFEEKTGIKLPKTKAGTLKAIDDFAGVSQEQRESIDSTRSDDQKKSGTQRELIRLGKRLSVGLIKDADGIERTPKEWVDKAIKDGYDNIIRSVINGKTKYALVNGKGSGYELGKIRIKKLNGLATEIRQYVLAVTGKDVIEAADFNAKIKTVQEEKKPQPKNTSTAEQDEKIEDFGEKLEGAKKDLWKDYKKSFSDELPTDLSEITLAKHFPEPDYAKLIADGAEVRDLAAVKAMRDIIPPKPRKSWKLKSWAGQVSSLREFTDDILNGRTEADTVVKMMRETSSGLAKIADNIDLYTELGYPAFTKAKDWSVGYASYSMYDGKRYDPPKNMWSLSKGRSFGRAFDTREEAVNSLRGTLTAEIEAGPQKRKVTLDLFKDNRTGDFFIGKKIAAGKIIRLKEGFNSSKEAREYMKENENDLVEDLEKRRKTRSERRESNNPRVGQDYRGAEDATPEKFAAEFGFRGVQFGNYVEQGRRAMDLNDAYDALMDMSAIVGIPSRAVSLNGTLGLAFGARGSGGINPAAAHYESDNIVINMTKASGAGSLGHEWFHAMDHYFGSKKGGLYLTENYKYSPELRKEISEAFEGVVSAIDKTGMEKRSKEIDKTRSKDYWSTVREMGARAFEAYLVHKADVKKESNDYLANILGEESWNILYGENQNTSTYPYPTKAEMEKYIAPAFDKLFETIQTEETGDGVAMFSLGNGAAQRLQSSLIKAADGLKQAKATGDQYLAMLRKTAGVKEEEIAWTGLDDFLAGRKGVTKKEVVDYLNDNQVQVNEVVLGQTDDNIYGIRDPNTDEIIETATSRPEAERRRDALEEELDRTLYVEAVSGTDELSGEQVSGETKFSKYTLPGGENYREVLFTLPTENYDNIQEQLGDFEKYPAGSPERAKLRSKQEQVPDSFKSSHFDQPNIIAHVRLNDRTDADGNRVLFIEEIQSDWHQAGRKKGYKNDTTVDTSGWTAEKTYDNGVRIWIIKDANGNKVHSYNFSDQSPEQVIERAAEVKRGRENITAVPDAPFKKSWHEMAFRRVAQMAAQGGYDRVAWTPGQIQNDRYDLSHQVSEINVFNHGDGKKWDISARTKGGNRLKDIATDIPAEKLSDYIGKELAERAVKEKTDRGWKNFSGVDLKVGGEGMKGFYDNILVKYANKFGKKYGSSSSTVFLENRGGISGEEIMRSMGRNPDDWSGFTQPERDDMMRSYRKNGIKVWGLQITDDMRRSADAGFELFSRTGAVVSQERTAEAIKQIEDALNDRMRTYGYSTADVRLFNDARETGIPGVPDDVQGAYYRGIIHISLNAKDPLAVLDHEAIHDLRAAGAFTEAEWRLLEAKAPQWRDKYGIDALDSYGGLGLSETRLNEEAIAHAFQDAEVSGPVRRIANRVLRFLREIKAFLTGNPYQFNSVEEIFDAVRRGEISKRKDTKRSTETDEITSSTEGIKTNTDAFKKWFGDSKVVDKNGKPLVVYHGTGYDLKTIKQVNTKASLNEGIYFTDSPVTASAYAYSDNDIRTLKDNRPILKRMMSGKVAPNVYPVYLSIKNPYIDNGSPTPSQRSLKKQGYDGIIRERGGGETHYVAFEPTQIKSVFNQGTFDPDSEFIMYSLPKSPAPALKQAKETLATIRGAGTNLMADLGRVSAMVLHPHQIATLYKEFTPVYRAVIERFKQREVLIHQLSRPLDFYNSLNDAAKKKVNAVLEIGRIDGKNYKPDDTGKIVVKNEGLKNTVHSRDGQTITLTPAEAAAYAGVRMSMDMALDKFTETILEEHGLLEKGVKTVQDVEKLRLKALKAGDFNEAKRFKEILSRLHDVQDAKKRGYIPFKRWGEIGISVRDNNDLDENGRGKLVHFERVELPAKPLRKARIGENKPVQEALDRLGDKYNAKQYDINTFEMSKFDEVNANLDLRSLDVLAASSDMSSADYDRLRETLEREMQKKGFRAHFFRSNDVPGYSEDFERAINDYVVSISSYISRRLNERKIEARVSEVSSAGKSGLYEYARDYQGYVNNPEEELATIRMMGFFWYLAGNVSSGMVNLSQPFLVTAPWLKSMFSHRMIGKEMTRAYADVLKMVDVNLADRDFFNFDKAPADVRQALKDAYAEGDFISMSTNDAMAISNSSSQALRGLEKNKRKAADAISLTFSIPERINRIATFIAAYRLANPDVMTPAMQKKIDDFIRADELAKSMMSGKNTQREKAFAFAEYAVVSTQYRVGKLNRPKMARGFGSLVFQFYSFVMQTFELMYKLNKTHGSEGKKALAVMILSIVAVAGLKGLPFEDDMQDLVEALYKLATGTEMDVDAKARELIVEYTGSPLIAEMIIKGVPAAMMNLDLSGRLGFGSIAPDSGSDFLGIWWDMLYERPVQAGKYVSEGQYLKAAAEVSPAFLRNPLQAYIWSEDGIRTRYGNKVIDAGDVSEADIALKFLGFTSADISRERERIYATDRASKAVNVLRSRYYSKLAKAFAERKMLSRSGDTDGAAQAAAKIKSIKLEINRHNQVAPLYERIDINEASLKRKVAEELSGAEAKRIRKQARPRAKELKEIYDID